MFSRIPTRRTIPALSDELKVKKITKAGSRKRGPALIILRNLNYSLKKRLKQDESASAAFSGNGYFSQSSAQSVLHRVNVSSSLNSKSICFLMTVLSTCSTV